MAGWVIAAAVALIAVIALLVWWLWPGTGSGTDTDAAATDADPAECIQGDLTLPVASDAASAEATLSLIESWAATDPVVRDYCVTPEMTDDVESAAAYVGITDGALVDGGRAAATSGTTPVAAVEVGIAGAAGAGADMADVAFPVADQPGVSQVVASALSEDRDAVIGALIRDRELTAEQAAGAENYAATRDEAGEDFTVLATVEAAASALTSTNAVSEEQSRAAAAFVEHAGEQYSAPEEGTATVDEEILAAVAAGEAPAETEDSSPAEEPADPAAEAAAPANTLFVVDTSRYMANSMGRLSEIVQGSAQDLAAAGQESALWNFSSPLNPGVTQGFRANLGFGASPEEIGRAVDRFGTAGVPQSRSAAVASVNTATARAQETGQPVRVVLVTTGTEGDMSDEVFAERFKPSDDVELVVVHVGQAQPDPVLTEAADQAIETDLGGLPEALDRVVGA